MRGFYIAILVQSTQVLLKLIYFQEALKADHHITMKLLSVGWTFTPVIGK